jgi:hypothetical protein
MADIAQTWGSDLQVSASGDLLTADGTQLGQQRVLRRLLTNVGDYIWQLSYGAGLGGFVGSPVNAQQIQAIARQQMYREAVVARNPAPVITVNTTTGGTVTLNIQYVDAPSNQPVVLSFSLTG